MRYMALAAGFDGILAQDGRSDQRCGDALRALSATGRKLILVTARELRELLEIFPEARLFDCVVAENGAVMHRPATRQSEILAQAPPEFLLQELRRRHVTPLSVGSSIVTTEHAHEHEISEALRKLRLDFQLVTNPGALMLLPAGVSKASGVRAALQELGISAHNLVTIGDSENDLALFELAEHAVAVQNASPVVKQVADCTTQGAYCDGFLELAHDLIATDLVDAVPRHKIVLDLREGLKEVSFVPGRDSLQVCGPAGSGKAAICHRLLERMLGQGYQCCVIASDLSSWCAPSPSPGAAPGAALPGLIVLGEAYESPTLAGIVSALEQPDTSVAVNLAALPLESRAGFIEALLLQLQALHTRSGRPHAIFIHQAQSLLGSARLSMIPRSQITMIYESETECLPVQREGAAERSASAKALPRAGRRIVPPANQAAAPGAAQAIAAGGACRISVFLPDVAPGAGSLSSAAVASMPEY